MTDLKHGSFVYDVKCLEKNMLFFAIFVISFFMFKFMMKRRNLNSEEIERKRKKAEKYFDRHIKENEEFFMMNE
jgi:hypothetical protein